MAKVNEQEKVDGQREKNMAKLPDGENTRQCTETINSLNLSSKAQQKH